MTNSMVKVECFPFSRAKIVAEQFLKMTHLKTEWQVAQFLSSFGLGHLAFTKASELNSQEKMMLSAIALLFSPAQNVRLNIKPKLTQNERDIWAKIVFALKASHYKVVVATENECLLYELDILHRAIQNQYRAVQM